MARVVNAEEHAAKRGEILAVARRLVQTRGYERMAIQDILDELQISKGAFYHYFRSKQALLVAIIEHMLDDVFQLFIPVVRDSHLPALDKLQRCFSLIVRWRTEQKAFVLELARVWLADDNAVVRQKLHATGVQRTAPLLAAIIRQGVREGVFTTPYPDHAGVVLLSLLESLNETLVGLLLSSDPERNSLRCLEDAVAAYADSMARVLGAPPGSLPIIDSAILNDWIDSPGVHA
jgi:AcrR family transcriptional regulator